VTTTADPDADIDIGELVETNDEERFIDLESEDFRLGKRQRLSVHFNKALSLLTMGHGSGCLLLAEALHTLC